MSVFEYFDLNRVMRLQGFAVGGGIDQIVLQGKRALITEAWKVDGSDFVQPVSIAGLPLPAGAATDASLAAILVALGGHLFVRTDAGDVLTVDGSGVVQPISVAALPLPAGAATEVTLATIFAVLDARLSTLPARDRTDAAGPFAVRLSNGVSFLSPLTDAELRASAVLVDASGSVVVVTGPLTDAQLRASPVPVSGPLTDAQLRALAVPVDASGATVPVSGPLTNAQLRAAAVPVDASGATVPVSGPLTDTQLRASAVPVSGPLTDTQLRAAAVPISAAALPTHGVTIADGSDAAEGVTTDAAVVTDAAGTLSGKLRGLVKWAFERMPASLGQKAMSASLPVVVASDQSAVPVSGPLTDTQLRASAVPVSGPLTDTQLRASAVPVSLASVPAHGVTIADGSDAAEGVTTDAAVVTDAAGTLSGKLRGLVKWAFERMPASLGQKAMSASLPVVVASDQSAIPVSENTTARLTYVFYAAGLTITATKLLFDLFNAAGSGKIVYVEQIKAFVRNTAAVTGINLTLEATRTTAIGTAGTGITSGKLDTTNATISASITARNTPTGGATAAGAVIAGTVITTEDAAFAAAEGMLYESGRAGVHVQPLTLREGEGLRIDTGPLGAAGTIALAVTVSTN